MMSFREFKSCYLDWRVRGDSATAQTRADAVVMARAFYLLTDRPGCEKGAANFVDKMERLGRVS